MEKYNSIQTITKRGKKIVHKVTIKHNKGFKSVTKYHKGRKVHSVKKPIHSEHVHLIKKGKFIPGLFSDCKFCKSKKCKHCNTKKKYGGIGENDRDFFEQSPKYGPLYVAQRDKEKQDLNNSYNKLNSINQHMMVNPNLRNIPDFEKMKTNSMNTNSNNKSL
jgi:hypothetical protein